MRALFSRGLVAGLLHAFSAQCPSLSLFFCLLSVIMAQFHPLTRKRSGDQVELINDPSVWDAASV